jgi:hypothetical protein
METQNHAAYLRDTKLVCMVRRSGWLLFLVIFCRCAPAQSDTNSNTSPPSLKAAHLPAQVRNDIVAAIAEGFQDQPKEFPSGEKIALGSWVSFVRLSQTGPAAILISSGPDDPFNGATGNDEIWLFRRVGDRAVLILRGGGYDPSSVRGPYHYGMLDFQTSWNMGCCGGSTKVYRFDGIRYKAAYCYSYAEDEKSGTKYGPHEKCSD